jgi:hypothetical protein
MKLPGRRILVLVAEHMVAPSIRNVLEKEDAAVMVGPYNRPPHFDGEWSHGLLVKTLADADVPVIAHTGDSASFQKRFPGTPVISKLPQTRTSLPPLTCC